MALLRDDIDVIVQDTAIPPPVPAPLAPAPPMAELPASLEFPAPPGAPLPATPPIPTLPALGPEPASFGPLPAFPPVETVPPELAPAVVPAEPPGLAPPREPLSKLEEFSLQAIELAITIAHGANHSAFRIRISLRAGSM
jgi:hypothetical protein